MLYLLSIIFKLKLVFTIALTVLSIGAFFTGITYGIEPDFRNIIMKHIKKGLIMWSIVLVGFLLLPSEDDLKKIEKWEVSSKVTDLSFEVVNLSRKIGYLEAEIKRNEVKPLEIEVEVDEQAETE